MRPCNSLHSCVNALETCDRWGEFVLKVCNVQIEQQGPQDGPLGDLKLQKSRRRFAVINIIGLNPPFSSCFFFPSCFLIFFCLLLACSSFSSFSAPPPCISPICLVFLYVECVPIPRTEGIENVLLMKSFNRGHGQSVKPNLHTLRERNNCLCSLTSAHWTHCFIDCGFDSLFWHLVLTLCLCFPEGGTGSSLGSWIHACLRALVHHTLALLWLSSFVEARGKPNVNIQRQFHLLPHSSVHLVLFFSFGWLVLLIPPYCSFTLWTNCQVSLRDMRNADFLAHIVGGCWNPLRNDLHRLHPVVMKTLQHH